MKYYNMWVFHRSTQIFTTLLQLNYLITWVKFELNRISIYTIEGNNVAIASTFRDHFRKRTLLASYFAESFASMKSSDYFKDLSKHKEGNELIILIRLHL